VPGRFFSLRGDENNGNLDAGVVQLALKIDAAHSGQVHVENELVPAPNTKNNAWKGITFVPSRGPRFPWQVF